MKISVILASLLIVGSRAADQQLPNDSLMNLLVNKGYAKEKEDNIDLKCGCDCTCCQKRHS